MRTARAGSWRMAAALAAAAIALALAAGGCGKKPRAPLPPAPPSAPPTARPVPGAPGLARTGYAIQVGAFAQVANAERFTRALRLQGLDAFYFLYKSGLYKVRFGDFATREAARSEAERLQRAGAIGDYFIVSPETYSVAEAESKGEDFLRDRIVRTAESFIGTPYQWGGTSPEEGFDCSGLAQAVYRLNGLNLPRSAAAQYDAGRGVEADRLQKGDLVFFSIARNGRISHVGIYCGDGAFIHAPGAGKRIRTDRMADSYFSARYEGGRKYF
ncbi:MAG TPA: NlpC/P60 family protein [Acidobacteriota bacterium]|nr:NlpC/P60 family protein [Acidobacteriota bacterium]